MVTLGTAVQDSGGDGSTQAQHRHNQTVPLGRRQILQSLVTLLCQVSTAYCMARRWSPLDNTEVGGASSSCPSSTVSLGFEPWTYGAG